jgi:hypothetical protein
VTRPSEASVVAIRLTLDGRSGVTLWATPWLQDGEEWQAFLGSGRRVLVFADPAGLADFLRSGAENDLTDHPSWRTLQRLAPEQLEPEEGYDFDLDGVYDLAAEDPDPFTVSELSDLVDIVQRIAECCDDGTLLRLVEETPEFAGLLADDVSYSGADGEERWTELGQALDRSWELVVDRLGELVEWRGTAEVGDQEETTEQAGIGEEAGVPGRTGGRDEAEESGERGQRGDAEDEEPADTAWAEAGIVPIEVTLPTGIGYTLRTYVDDEPRFLGTDLTVDMFATTAGLLAFCRTEDQHDLANLDTWSVIRDAEDDALQIAPAEEETYDLTAPGAEAIELARDLADYCQLAGVEEALAGRSAETGVSFDVWVAAIAEIASCVSWHD